MPRPSKGLDTAEKISEENKSSGFYRVRTYFMKDGEVAYLRYLTPMDEMITADTHSYCETKPRPAEYKGATWQEHMPAICQNDRMFLLYDENDRPTGEYEPGYGDCFIHNRDRGKLRDGKFKKDKSVPDTQTYALAVVREPIPDPVSGKPVGFKDCEDDYKKEDGTVVRIPRIVVISQKHYNYWSGVEAAMFLGGDVRGQDFRVARKDTGYTFVGLGQDPKLNPETPAWNRYASALQLVGYDLETEILKMASPDWYARWFDPARTPEGGYGRHGSDGEGEDGEGAVPAAEPPDQAKVDALRERMQAARQ